MDLVDAMVLQWTYARRGDVLGLSSVLLRSSATHRPLVRQRLQELVTDPTLDLPNRGQALGALFKMSSPEERQAMDFDLGSELLDQRLAVMRAHHARGPFTCDDAYHASAPWGRALK